MDPSRHPASFKARNAVQNQIALAEDSNLGAQALKHWPCRESVIIDGTIIAYVEDWRKAQSTPTAHAKADTPHTTRRPSQYRNAE